MFARRFVTLIYTPNLKKTFHVKMKKKRGKGID